MRSYPFAARHSGIASLWLAALTMLACAADDRPAPRFAGKVIPDPPQQKEPWTPPQTKLPRFLATATAGLFVAGMADPRGCEYREVERAIGALSIKSPGFVLPESPGDVGRFVIGWNGAISPAISFGSPANLEADVRAMAEALRKGRDQAAAGGRWQGTTGGFAPGSHHEIQIYEPGKPLVAPPSRSPLALAMLLRLGRADLAESLFAAGTTWTTETPRRDLTDYGITFLSLAQEWASDAYGRLVTAHQGGEDAIALDVARRLAAFRKAVNVRAEAMGFSRPQPTNREETDSYLGPFEQFGELLADQERRAREPVRGPIPARGGDPKPRIAALIRDFDQIHVYQFSSPGSAHPGGAPIVRELIAEGDPAVEPLLAALADDARLTRSVSNGRGAGPGYVHPVVEAEFSALKAILHEDRFFLDPSDDTLLRTPEGRVRLAGAARASWVKNRSVPLAERWYRMLRDDAAGADRWLEAAAGITGLSRTPPWDNFGYHATSRPGRAPELTGESLRSRRDPSVTELMARRAAEIARAGDPFSHPDGGLSSACRMAEMLSRWDMPAALPSLKTLMTACRERSRNVPQGYQADQGYGRILAEFTLIRERAGDHEALDEYAAWARGVTPAMVENSLFTALEPMWLYPRHPAIAEAARALFTDPKSPWLPLVPRERIAGRSPFDNPIASPLVCLEGFREALIAALGDRTPVGTASLGKEGQVSYQLTSGQNGGMGNQRTPEPEDRLDVEVTIRACDIVASTLSTLEGAPEAQLYWDEARRDKAASAIADYLRRFGPRLSAEPLPGNDDFPHARAHLRFPMRDRPATAEDVREARAIFSLDGEAHFVALPEPFPLRARWAALKSFPIDQHFADGTTRRDYLQDGWVWQAEEVRTGDRWERSYGFVGHATIARVAASEILLPGDRFRSGELPDGLEARAVLVDAPDAGYARGAAIALTLRLRNARGEDRPVPSEFVRPGDDGRPSLRRGIGLTLQEIRQDPEGSGAASRPPAPKASIREARFDPGPASRVLRAAESFDPLRVDLRDWFGPLGAGVYRVAFTFAEGSGLGPGASGDEYFTVIDPGR